MALPDQRERLSLNSGRHGQLSSTETLKGMYFMLDQPRQNTAHNNNIRNTALGLMGLFIGMLIFIVGVTVGAVLTDRKSVV